MIRVGPRKRCTRVYFATHFRSQNLPNRHTRPCAAHVADYPEALLSYIRVSMPVISGIFAAVAISCSAPLCISYLTGEPLASHKIHAAHQ